MVRMSDAPATIQGQCAAEVIERHGFLSDGSRYRRCTFRATSGPFCGRHKPRKNQEVARAD